MVRDARYEAAARALVATWPPLTEQAQRELTTLAVRHSVRQKIARCPGCGDSSCQWKRLECDQPVRKAA